MPEKISEPCPMCDATGKRDDEDCTFCDGTGYIVANANSEDGDEDGDED